MEAIFSVLQSLVLIFLPMQPVSLTSVQTDSVRPSQEEWRGATSSAALRDVVKGALSGTPGKYHIYIKHLASGETYQQGADEELMSASMYKVWLAAAVLREIQQKRLNNNQVLSESAKELNTWAGLTSETAEITSGTIKFSVSEALSRMIAVSHNYAAFLLTREVGNPKVQKVLTDQGLTSSHFVRPPKVSTADMALFYERVYRGRFFEDEKYSQRLRDLLAGNEFNDRIPKLLPDGTRVEHKTGELDKFKHDCGIVYSRGGDYIMCVMSETDDPEMAAEKIAELSREVYEYFNKD